MITFKTEGERQTYLESIIARESQNYVHIYNDYVDKIESNNNTPFQKAYIKAQYNSELKELDDNLKQLMKNRISKEYHHLPSQT